jgi:hypothetical protein
VVDAAGAMGKEKLITASQEFTEDMVAVGRAATLCASSTADEKKKAMMLDGGSKVRTGGPNLIIAAKSVSERYVPLNRK